MTQFCSKSYLYSINNETDTPLGTTNQNMRETDFVTSGNCSPPSTIKSSCGVAVNVKRREGREARTGPKVTFSASRYSIGFSLFIRLPGRDIPKIGDRRQEKQDEVTDIKKQPAMFCVKFLKTFQSSNIRQLEEKLP